MLNYYRNSGQGIPTAPIFILAIGEKSNHEEPEYYGKLVQIISISPIKIRNSNHCSSLFS